MLNTLITFVLQRHAKTQRGFNPYQCRHCAKTRGMISHQITTDKESIFSDAMKGAFGPTIIHRDSKYLNNRNGVFKMGGTMPSKKCSLAKPHKKIFNTPGL